MRGILFFVKEYRVITALSCILKRYNILLAMRGINRNLSSTLTEIDTAANQVSVGSEQVSGSAQSLSQGAAEQSLAITQLTAGVEQISL